MAVYLLLNRNIPVCYAYPALEIFDGGVEGTYFVTQMSKGMQGACQVPFRDNILARARVETIIQGMRRKNGNLTKYEAAPDVLVDEEDGIYVTMMEYVAMGCVEMDSTLLLAWAFSGIYTICVVDRGGCSFGTKANTCKKSGAAAVLVVDFYSEITQSETGLSTSIISPRGIHGSEVVIPTFLISYADGTAIKNVISTGQYISGRLFTEAEVLESSLPIGLLNTGRNSSLRCVNAMPDWEKAPASLLILDAGRPGGTSDIYSWSAEVPGTSAYYVGVENRGFSSQFHPKRQVGMEVWDEEQQDLAVELLGLPKEADWILGAPYADKSLLRNVVAYDFYRRTGQYAPRTQFLEMMISDDAWDAPEYPRHYHGLFFLVEKIKRDGDRVDVRKNKFDENEDITGGYLFKVDHTDREDTEESITTSLTKTEIILEYPRPKNVRTDAKPHR
ncbi:hypothetical protein CYMTET_53171, partial [Cymbomonas tetramitiformis]